MASIHSAWSVRMWIVLNHRVNHHMTGGKGRVQTRRKHKARIGLLPEQVIKLREAVVIPISQPFLISVMNHISLVNHN